MTAPNFDIAALAPEIFLVAGSLLILVLDLVLRDKRLLGWLAIIVVLLSLAANFLLVPTETVAPALVLADGLGRFLGAAILIAALLAVLVSMDHVLDFTHWTGAYYALLLLTTTGMHAMVIANDFIIIFLGLEILSLALYVLVDFNRKDARSSEASLKYFLLGAFSSGFFLYGIALIYAATGSTNLTTISQGLALPSVPLPGVPLLPIGMGLLLVGFGFKLALVPFHMWTPDVYQAAPTTLVAFMSVSTKAAAFGALIRVLASLTAFDQPWLLALAALSAITMTLGNLAALRQLSIKRMLAYSSIAHAGYVLSGLAAGNEQGAQGALYYLLAYTFMNLGAFAVLVAVQRRDENDVSGERMVGLGARQPVLAAVMALFLLSLTGIPPLAGFFGKLYVFTGAVSGGLAWLAVLGMINSALAAYYYLRVIVSMYMAEPAPAAAAGPPTRSGALSLALLLAAVGTVGFGLWQVPWMETIGQAVAILAFR